MCGIVGYLGKRTALPIVLKALEKLEYRSYNSCGVLIYDTKENKLTLKKTAGMIKDLKGLFEEKFNGTIGIGHTRWATHGEVTEFNAHPHYDCQKEILLSIMVLLKIIKF
jgi:glucosamine--fructose-6-phosphate aminotransferase (isomerizing)